MSTVPLPNEPSLEQLKKLAKDLRSAVRAGEPTALAHVAEHYPDGTPAGGDRAGFTLATAQLVIARHYGFASWPRLRRHLQVVADYLRTPDRVEPGADPADEFLRLASLTYGDDGPERWRQARQLLAEHPEIAGASVHAAAAVADPIQVQAFLADDRTLAGRLGGPYRWGPLCYLAYARHDPDVPADATLDTAAILLAHGANPNEGYLWHGLPSPFTVLTGVFGEGELGPLRQPRHPHALALARVLLAAGANANDSQTLYNRMFRPDNDHLELLFEYGLGTGDGGPWRARLGSALDSPEELIRAQLSWAVTHDQQARVRLLVEHGVDFRTPFADGRTPCQVAKLNGSTAIVEYLVSKGAEEPDLDPVAGLVAAALAVDRSELDRLRAAHPGLVDAVRAGRPALIVWAAASGRTEAVALLAELGFDVNALGRADVPVERPWQTALHQAAGDGDVELARLLLSLGADPNLRDARFGTTPLAWARYFERDEMAALLAPLTDGGSPP